MAAMARQDLSVAASIASSPAAFEAQVDALLATLLNHLIGGWAITLTDKLPAYNRVLRADLDVDDTGTAITSPYQVRVFLGQDVETADALVDAFRAANPSYWFAPAILCYSDQLPNIQLRYVYVLLYNQDATDGAANWQPGYVAGGGSGGTFTNPDPTTITVGGIAAGSTFPTPQTLQQMMDAMLYPYQAPAFSSFSISGQATPLEVGDQIPASVTFIWATSQSANVQANSISITDITGGNIVLASGLANDGSQPIVMGGPIQRTTAGSWVFRIAGVNTHLAAFTRDATYSWRWRTFYGFGAFSVPTEAQIEALASSALSTAIAGSYAMGATGYKFICAADAIGGQINTVKDSLTLLDVPMATAADDAAYSNVDGGGYSYALVSVTNAFGVTGNYRVYRTKNSLGSTITLVVT